MKKNKHVTKKKYTKKKLWSIFDSEINDKKIERVYSIGEQGTREFCDLCGKSLKINNERFLTCTNNSCGIIYKDILDQAPEWRFYGSGDRGATNPTRCGMPINPLLKQSSYGCKVMCNSKSTYEMRKIRRYTEWGAMPYKEKSQYDEFEKIKDMAKKSGLPKIIVDTALIYHKKISDQKTFRGLNRHGIIAASIYISCRINNYPRTSKEIACIFQLDHHSATKGCKNAVSILNIVEKDMENNEKTYFHQTKPISFIERFCSKLNLNDELTELCVFIALRLDQNNIIPENTPHSVAAGIIYFISQICNIGVNKRDVSMVSKISEVTINKCYKKLRDLKRDLVPSCILEKYYV